MKNIARSRWILGIILVVFSVIAFAVPFHKNGVFFLAYGFGVIAIGIQLHALRVAFVKEENVKSKFYGFPIANISVVYMLFQLILSLIAMALAKITPLWIPLIVFVALLGATAAGLIAADAMRDEIERQDIKLHQNVSVMRHLQSRISYTAAQNQNAEMVSELNKLSDAFRYSDPVSSPETAEMEKEMGVYLDELQKAVTEEDITNSMALCKKVHAVLNERNRICKLSK